MLFARYTSRSTATREIEELKVQYLRRHFGFAQKFDEGLKKVFSDDKAAQYLKFGSPRDNDPDHGVKAGRLTLTW